MPVTTISKKNKKTDQFVTISRKEYEEFLALKQFLLKKNANIMVEDHILRISQEAKSLKKNGKLSILRSLKDIR